MVATAVVRPLAGGPEIRKAPTAEPTGLDVIGYPIAGRSSAVTGRVLSRTSSGNCSTRGAAGACCRRIALASWLMALSCATMSGDPPKTATWSSARAMRARPGGDSIERMPGSAPASAYSVSSASRRVSRRWITELSRGGSDGRPVGGENDVNPERPPVGGERGQRVEPFASVEHLELLPESGEAVEQDQDARLMRLARDVAVLGDGSGSDGGVAPGPVVGGGRQGTQQPP